MPTHPTPPHIPAYHILLSPLVPLSHTLLKMRCFCNDDPGEQYFHVSMVTVWVTVEKRNYCSPGYHYHGNMKILLPWGIIETLHLPPPPTSSDHSISHNYTRTPISQIHIMHHITHILGYYSLITSNSLNNLTFTGWVCARPLPGRLAVPCVGGQS